jgi:hypothetical protein
MRYIDTAFQQLEFAWKLYNYVLEGHINLNDLDKPLTVQEGQSVLVLRDRLLHTPDDLVIACENNLGIAFGAAAITLNRCREEAGLRLPDPICSEIDQFTSLAYQIRNAFAHDIAEPRWNLKNSRYARMYEFGGIHVDLTHVGSKHFEYSDIGGPEVLFWMKDYGQEASFEF